MDCWIAFYYLIELDHWYICISLYKKHYFSKGNFLACSYRPCNANFLFLQSAFFIFFRSSSTVIGCAYCFLIVIFIYLLQLVGANCSLVHLVCNMFPRLMGRNIAWTLLPWPYLSLRKVVVYWTFSFFSAYSTQWIRLVQLPHWISLHHTWVFFFNLKYGNEPTPSSHLYFFFIWSEL